ncbi:hypothetical protein [Haladaptatus sp. NG-SE-30]
MAAVSLESERTDDVFHLDFGDSPRPFEPEGVLETDHDGDVVTVFTIAGGGASLVLSRVPTHPVISITAEFEG